MYLNVWVGLCLIIMILPYKCIRPMSSGASKSSVVGTLF